MNLSNIQNENSLYNFIMIIKSVNSIFINLYKITLKRNIYRNINILLIFDLIKLFQNYLQINKIISKTFSYIAFTILQEESAKLVIIT